MSAITLSSLIKIKWEILFLSINSITLLDKNYNFWLLKTILSSKETNEKPVDDEMRSDRKCKRIIKLLRTNDIYTLANVSCCYRQDMSRNAITHNKHHFSLLHNLRFLNIQNTIAWNLKNCKVKSLLTILRFSNKQKFPLLNQPLKQPLPVSTFGGPTPKLA